MSVQTPASKLPESGTTIFTVMSQMAQEHDAINLAQGFPDFGVSPELMLLVSNQMKLGNNQYAPMQGLPQLRRAIAQKIRNVYGIEVDPLEEVTITAGATEGLHVSISALVGPGDEVIILEPSYDSYGPSVKLNGGVPVYVSLRAEDYSIDWDAVREAVTPKTRAIIINTPHNPTGAVIRAEDVLELEKLVQEHDLFVISDEVYEHLVFDGEVHETMLKSPVLRQRSVCIYSFGKTFHATGWKVGYTVAPPELTREIRKIHQYINFSVNTPTQFALAEFLENPENYMHLAGFYEKKRNLFLELMSDSRFEPVKTRGTYFQLFSYQEISSEGDYDMAVRLTREQGVASIPVSVFYKELNDRKVLRFCFAKQDGTLEKAAEILCRI